MQARSIAFPSEQLAQRWRDLADRRRSYFFELYESGRWRLYYTEAEFIVRLRDVIQAAEQWEKLASAPVPLKPPVSFSSAI
jgi:uncharacterized repeat protein (TIGR03809 family)